MLHQTAKSARHGWLCSSAAVLAAAAVILGRRAAPQGLAAVGGLQIALLWGVLGSAGAQRQQGEQKQQAAAVGP